MRAPRTLAEIRLFNFQKGHSQSRNPKFFEFIFLILPKLKMTFEFLAKIIVYFLDPPRSRALTYRMTII